ncbi:flagellar biosynthetic protein FliR [Iodidimonas muriae]|uniref:Flagellar biosynthetic protein FliR n=1 Tax=Iodidimonas muriae TaxID=261467 RepID=A0ABQ2LFS5_9PROT|nr:flagellar biosynthetic protein FliR [Iodidimonas muriae]GER08597.1 flagellar biosynthetic protein FliR [Kordiimonadales bacterium JCM 17843]GGO15488.1 flagellar biosynthetic protein FliR [Iodidimonas muriae]
MTVQAFLSGELYLLMLVFSRIGTALMFIPGFGESFLSTRIRLIAALVLTWALAPIVRPETLRLPSEPFLLFQDVFIEVLVGLFLGLSARMFITALISAGQMISQIIGLSNIFVMPNVAIQLGSVIGGFLLLAGLVFIFASGLHLLSIDALARSYAGMPLGQPPDITAMTQNFIAVVATGFRLAVQLASPFLVLGFVYYLGLGLMNKAMQQLPVFFVSIPAAVAGGVLMLILVISGMLMTFRDVYADWLTVIEIY